MKKIVLMLAFMLVLSSCAPGKNVGKVALSADHIVMEQELIDYSDADNRTQIYDKWSAGEKRLGENPMFAEFSGDYWGFSNDLFKMLGKDGNLVFSPLSAYIPLSELSYAMDDCPPKEELIRLLRANSANEYWTKMLMNSFQASGYLVGSSIWISDRCQPNSAFLKENLSSDIYRINFADKNAAKLQMDWINKWTKGFLKEQVKPEDFGDSSTDKETLVCRLIGTAYIKDEWREKYFSEKKEGIFYADNGQEQKVPFLYSEEFSTAYRKAKDYEMIEIPLKNGRFLIVLPSKEAGVDKLIAENVLMEVRKNEDWDRVDAEVIMPDFTESGRMELLPILKELGYQEITTFQKGYSNLVGKDPSGEDRLCAISQILQESKIEVKKEGIQAASYTKVDVKEASAAIMEERPKVKIEVNRPYLYLVMDNNNLPSFIGVNRGFEK